MQIKDETPSTGIKIQHKRKLSKIVSTIGAVNKEIKNENHKLINPAALKNITFGDNPSPPPVQIKKKKIIECLINVSDDVVKKIDEYKFVDIIEESIKTSSQIENIQKNTLMDQLWDFQDQLENSSELSISKSEM